MDAFQRYSTANSGTAMGDPGQGSTSTSNGGGGGRRRRSREFEALSVEIRKYPRDLFHSFLSTEPIKALNRSASEEQEDGEIELNLGLSLGGRFGVDKSNGGLIRASSIAGAVPTFREVQESAAMNAAALTRTASLPVETEEEWRRRKEMQTLRRMEAKRRRSEKQRSIKENSSNGTGEERERQQLGLGVLGKLSPNPGPVQWGGSSRQGSSGIEAAGMKGKGGFFGSLQGLLAQQVPQQQLQGCSQGSAESYGGGSSGVSELQSKTLQGSGSCGEARSPASTHSTQERGSQEASPVGSSSSTKYTDGSTSKHPETPHHKKKNAAAAAAPGGIEDMPCVFTIGDGPNGRKVEGILYKYGKGEGVRIMCVCHGSFFSPAEFVKHAGGYDMEHPLRHIVVNPSPSAF